MTFGWMNVADPPRAASEGWRSRIRLAPWRLYDSRASDESTASHIKKLDGSTLVTVDEIGLTDSEPESTEPLVALPVGSARGSHS